MKKKNLHIIDEKSSYELDSTDACVRTKGWKSKGC